MLRKWMIGQKIYDKQENRFGFFRIIFVELSFNLCIFVSEYMCIYDNSIFRDSMYQAMIRGK